jgi:hypothetical protein
MDIHFYELFITFCLPLKLDQNRLVQPVLVSAERSGIKPETNESRRDSVATRRGDSVLPRKIRDTRSPIVKLPAESGWACNRGCRRVPSLAAIAGILTAPPMRMTIQENCRHHASSRSRAESDRARQFPTLHSILLCITFG